MIGTFDLCACYWITSLQWQNELTEWTSNGNVNTARTTESTRTSCYITGAGLPNRGQDMQWCVERRRGTSLRGILSSLRIRRAVIWGRQFGSRRGNVRWTRRPTFGRSEWIQQLPGDCDHPQTSWLVRRVCSQRCRVLTSERFVVNWLTIWFSFLLFFSGWHN